MTSYYEVFEVHQAAEQESNQEVESLGYPQGSGREEWDDWAHHPGGVGQWSGQSYQESPSHTRSGWHAGRSWSVRWSGWGQRHYDNWSWDGQQSESGSVGSRASYANHPVPTTSFCWRSWSRTRRSTGLCIGAELSTFASCRGFWSSGEVTSVGDGAGPKEPGGEDGEGKKPKGKPSNSYTHRFSGRNPGSRTEIGGGAWTSGLVEKDIRFRRSTLGHASWFNYVTGLRNLSSTWTMRMWIRRMACRRSSTSLNAALWWSSWTSIELINTASAWWRLDGVPMNPWSPTSRGATSTAISCWVWTAVWRWASASTLDTCWITPDPRGVTRLWCAPVLGRTPKRRSRMRLWSWQLS